MVRLVQRCPWVIACLLIALPCGLGLQWYDQQTSPEPGGFNWLGGLYLAGVIATGLYAATGAVRLVVWMIKRRVEA